MAIGEILIYKIGVNNHIGFYEISSVHFNINSFFMSIDKSNKIIKFFATKNFSEKPIRIINYNKNEQMGFIPGIPTMVFGIVLMQAFKIFKMDTFPKLLNYAA